MPPRKEGRLPIRWKLVRSLHHPSVQGLGHLHGRHLRRQPCRCAVVSGAHRFGALLAFTVFQTGTNYSEIRATFAPECDSFVSGTISGVVTADGRLNLEGTLKMLDWFCDPDGDLQLSGWDTNVDATGSMTGRWAQRVTLNGREGSAHEEVELVTMSRSATPSPSR